MHSIELYHFQWGWVTSDPDFKVTKFFEVEYRKNTKLAQQRQSYYCTRGKIPNTWIGSMFGDLDWPLNASRGFVSISWASCLLSVCFCVRFPFLQQAYHVAKRILCINRALIVNQIIDYLTRHYQPAVGGRMYSTRVDYISAKSQPWCQVVKFRVYRAAMTVDGSDL